MRNNRGTIAALVAMVVCAIAGLGIVLYPVVSTQVNNWEQSRLAQTISDQMQHADVAVADAAMAMAHEYNAHVGTGTLEDPWVGSDVTASPEYQHYREQLNQYPAMAQLSIPAINVNLPVYHGTTDDVLFKGAGHLFGTHLPVGGVGTRAVITAHTGMQHATFFDNLPDLNVGDALYVRTIGEDLKYVVTGTEVVLPEDVAALRSVADRDLITLVTCTPYGANTHRLLVTAERAPMGPSEQPFGTSNSAWQWWMFLALGLAGLFVVVIISLLLWALYKGKK